MMYLGLQALLSTRAILMWRATRADGSDWLVDRAARGSQRTAVFQHAHGLYKCECVLMISLSP